MYTHLSTLSNYAVHTPVDRLLRHARESVHNLGTPLWAANNFRDHDPADLW
jgi:hypothetical protein